MLITFIVETSDRLGTAPEKQFGKLANRSDKRGMMQARIGPALEMIHSTNEASPFPEEVIGEA
jgi:hypothetical protein